MSAATFVDNLLSWFIQVSAISFAAAVLPMLFRIRHPKSQLAYYHSVLLLCFALPVLQSWQHPLLLISGSTSVAEYAAPTLSWPAVILGVVVLGIAAKLFWLGVGLRQLRSYRRAAIPLYPLPQSIRDARTQTGADALFCISKDVTGPATLGYIDPVVLLPVTFEFLDEDAQRSIACHELLHVRRKDWLVILLEEFVGALFWFNPAVRWLLGQAKLTREELVDAAVVRMTEAAPYIQALLSMAVVTKGRWPVPAAPFFTEGHLAHRMRSLLTNPRRSWIRLGVSYVSAASLLMAAGWIVMIWFPLQGEAQIVTPPGSRPPDVVFFRDPVLPAQTPKTFNMRVPGPQQFPLGVVGGPLSGPSGVGEFLLPVPPPPPPPPPPLLGTSMKFGFLDAKGIRVIRPGDKPTPEEIERFIQGFPERSIVQVTQAPDGTVQRITIQARRLANEANALRFFSDPSHPAGQAPAGATTPTESAGATDGVH
jgi:beta-lactamase regulating signal transducer with metallopeptidase domain